MFVRPRRLGKNVDKQEADDIAAFVKPFTGEHPKPTLSIPAPSTNAPSSPVP